MPPKHKNVREDFICAKASEVYFPELKLGMAKGALQVLSYLAKSNDQPQDRQIEEISRHSKAHQSTVTRNYLPDLLNEHYIQLKQTLYRKGSILQSFRVTPRGLILAIIYESSPIYDIPDQHKKYEVHAQKAMGLDRTPEYSEKTKEISMAFPSYKVDKKPVEVPGLPPHNFYSVPIEMMLRHNQSLFPINFSSVSPAQKEIAIRSAIFAAHKIGANGLPSLPAHFQEPSKELKKAMDRELDLKKRVEKHLKEEVEKFGEGNDNVCKICKLEGSELPPFEDFVGCFLSQPILREWGVTQYITYIEKKPFPKEVWAEFAKQELWKDWASLLKKNPPLEEKAAIYLTNEIAKLKTKQQDLSSQIASISTEIDSLQQAVNRL